MRSAAVANTQTGYIMASLAWVQIPVQDSFESQYRTRSESRYRTRFSNTGSQPNYNTNPNSNLKPNPALTLIGLEQHTQGLTLTFTELVSTIIFLYPSTLDIYMI